MPRTLAGYQLPGRGCNNRAPSLVLGWDSDQVGWSAGLTDVEEDLGVPSWPLLRFAPVRPCAPSWEQPYGALGGADNGLLCGVEPARAGGCYRKVSVHKQPGNRVCHSLDALDPVARQQARRGHAVANTEADEDRPHVELDGVQRDEQSRYRSPRRRSRRRGAPAPPSGAPRGCPADRCDRPTGRPASPRAARRARGRRGPGRPRRHARPRLRAAGRRCPDRARSSPAPAPARRPRSRSPPAAPAGAARGRAPSPAAGPRRRRRRPRRAAAERRPRRRARPRSRP